MTRTTTVDMYDRIEQIRTEILPPIESQIEEMEQLAEEAENPWDIPDDLEQRYQRMNQEAKNLRGEADTLEHYADDWGASEWTIREVSVGAVGKIQDDVAEASGAGFDGSGTPKQGYARKRTLEIAVKDQPNGAPEVADISDVVGDWLFDCVDEFNTTGEVELGNSSLRAMAIDSAN